MNVENEVLKRSKKLVTRYVTLLFIGKEVICDVVGHLKQQKIVV